MGGSTLRADSRGHSGMSVGRVPWNMRSTATDMPTKMMARASMYRAATSHWLCCRMPLRIRNSLTNRPNGGEPTMARKPPIHRAPVTGMVQRRPCTS